MVKVNRKLVALLLLSIMLVSMVAFSASAAGFEGVAATTGGNLNIWLEKTLKGTKIATVANGTKLGWVEDVGKGVGEVVYGGVTGYVRLRYVAKYVPPKAGTETYAWDGPAKAATTGGDLNIWADKSLKGTKLATIPNGTALEVIEAYKEGYAWVNYKGIEGYARTKYLAKVKPADPVKPAELAWDGDVKANTSGGDMNVWEKPNFTGKKMLTIKNGKPVGYAEAYKDGVAKIYDKKGGTLLGYARVKYLSKVAPTPVVPNPVVWAEDAVANTTGGDMHVWEKEDFTGKKIMTIKNGKDVGFVVAYKNGVAKVYEDASLSNFIGYARVRYVKPDVYVPEPEIEITKEIWDDVKVVGTAKDSVIYAWKDMTKKDGSKKGSYGAIPVGTELFAFESYDNGWTAVWLEFEDGDGEVAYIMTDYLEEVNPVVK